MPATLTFLRAWDIIFHNKKLTPTEKIVLAEVCRYYPKAYNGSNATIAYHTGLSVRTVQYALKSLSTGPTKRKEQGRIKRRAYIVRSYSHYRMEGRSYTMRIIAPCAMPGPIYPPRSTLKEAR